MPFRTAVDLLLPPRSRAAVVRGWRRLQERVGDWGDRAGLDAGLVAWASHFPLTRPIARRRAGALFDLCAGFVYSQVLTACVRLDLFEALRAGRQSESALARRLALPDHATRRLLLAAASLRLVKSAGPGWWRLGPLGRAVALDPGIAAMVAHHGLLYRDLDDPVALLRGEGTVRALEAFWPYGESRAADAVDPGRADGYTALMSASQAMVAREVLRVFDPRKYRRMVDVGGGDGTFLAAVAAAAPEIDLTLFDLPSVAPAATKRFAQASLAGRARVVAGDFRVDPVPRGADLVSLVRVLHDHDDDTVAHLIAAVHEALPPHGTLLVAEPMADAPGAKRVGAAYFGFYLLAMGRGRARSADELATLLRGAGFVDVAQRPTALPLVAGVLVARKSGAQV